MLQSARGQYRTVAGAAGLTAVALLPFTIHHLNAGHWYLASLIGALNLFAAAACTAACCCRESPDCVRRIGAVTAIVANVVALLSIQAQGADTIIWIYPIILANFYLLPLRAAAATSTAFAALCILAVAPGIGEMVLARLVVTAALSVFFGVVFSHAMTGQRRQLEHLASHDALTGVGNRFGMDRSLAEAVERKRRYRERCSVVLFDIDGFKAINDEIGHLRADAIIANLARLISDRIRAVDRLYRFGGEEFVLLLPHAGDRAAWQLAEGLRMDVEEYGFHGEARITVSAGVAELARDETALQWLERADEAMFRAKRAGRNRVMLASGADEAAPEVPPDPAGVEDSPSPYRAGASGGWKPLH